MDNFSQLRHACKHFGGEMMLDNKGIPSVYVPFKSVQSKTLIETDSEAVHPAFIISGRQIDEIYIGKYHGLLYYGCAHSIPFETPAFLLDWDDALRSCEEKGAGYHMLTLAEWALIGLNCYKEGFFPKGNNDYGRDIAEAEYPGIPCSYEDDGRVRHILEGTGTQEYFHNGSISGVWGMNGNVAQWIAGYRTVNGEIQIIADNNAAASVYQNAESTLWRAIRPDGSLVSPGSGDTLHWNWLDGKITLDTESTDEDGAGVYTSAFSELAVNTSNVGDRVPDILKALALFPDGEGSYGCATRTVCLKGERVAAAGGGYGDGSDAHVLSLNASFTRNEVSTAVGVRLAYCKMY